MIEVTEEEKDLRIALYEDKKENPKKTYTEIAKEFNLKANEVKKYIVDYCKAFNLQVPNSDLVLDKSFKQKKSELINEMILVEGRNAIVINELERTIIVRFIDNNESETIRKKDMKIMRPKHLRV